MKQNFGCNSAPRGAGLAEAIFSSFEGGPIYLFCKSVHEGRWGSKITKICPRGLWMAPFGLSAEQ